MCGIAGRISWDPTPERATLERMTRRLAHRGPDAEGYYLHGPAGLGHRRLSVIDLVASSQPMGDASRRFWIVFNGEIYNFKALRAELELLGHRFRTQGDTEVLLYAYLQWGTDCLTRLNGMFAFALWDAQEQQLLLARDRLGKKPLCYFPLPDGGILFASELKALLEDPAVPRRVDPIALSHYLSLNYTLTSHPILAGVRKLPPAHFLLLRRGTPLITTCYWDLAYHFHHKQRFRSEAEAQEAFAALLEDAVQQRLISDVPLGLFLSGGIDSSVVALAMRNLVSAREIHTFSIGFAQRSFNEADKALQLCDHLGLNHNASTIQANLNHDLPRIAYFADEPFADTSLIAMHHLATFARQSVTVALSGDGADEIVGGYSTYTADQIHHYTHWLPTWLIAVLEQAAQHLVPVSLNKVSFDYKLRMFLAGLHLPFPQAHYSWRTIFSQAEKRALLLPEWEQAAQIDPFADFAPFFAEVEGCHYLDQAMYVDLKTWLVDDILVKVDRTTMAQGLEARAPFLDYRLVEFAAALPVSMKINGLRRKHILKESQRARLPPFLLHRRKEGFNAPVSDWLTQAAASGGLLSPNQPIAANYLRQEVVATLWDDLLSKRRDTGLRLLGIIMLDQWEKQVLQNHEALPP